MSSKNMLIIALPFSKHLCALAYLLVPEFALNTAWGRCVTLLYATIMLVLVPLS